MSSVNRVILLGRLGRDPETRTFQNGGSVCNLSVATSEQWKDRNSGEKRERTEWHRVCIFAEPLVRIAEQYLRKGAQVYLEGQLETRKWQDQSGQDRYSTEIALRPYKGTLVPLGDRQGGQQGAQSNPADPARQEPDGWGGGEAGGWGYGAAGGAPAGYGAGDMEDEIPFAPESRA